MHFEIHSLISDSILAHDFMLDLSFTKAILLIVGLIVLRVIGRR